MDNENKNRDMELDEFKKLVGDDTDLELDNIDVDSILMEYGSAPLPRQNKSEKIEIIKPAEPEEIEDEADEELPEQVIPIKQPEQQKPQPKEIKNDIKKEIASGVDEVINKKEREKERNGKKIPRSVEERSAVKMAHEYEETVRAEEQEQIKEKKRVCSTDLRAFRRLMPADASNRAKSAVKYYRIRSIITAVLTIIAWYITAAPTYLWKLPEAITYMEHPYTYLFILAALQIFSMLTSVSIIADGLRFLVRGHLKMECIVSISSIVTLIHTVLIMLKPDWGGFLPYTCVSIFTMFISLSVRCKRYEAVYRVCKAASLSGGKFSLIKGMEDADSKVKTVYKTVPGALEQEFMDMILEEDQSEKLMRFYAPLVIVISLVFAILASFGTGYGKGFFWCLSAIMSVAYPCGIAMSFVYPFSKASIRLSQLGAAIAGSEGMKNLKDVHAAIVTDHDIFPTKMINVAPVTTFSSFAPEKVNLCALSVLNASGSGLYDAFIANLPRQPMNLPVAESFEFFETGGMSAYVNSEKVLIGTSNFILRMGIRIPEGVNAKSSVFVAVNMQLAGAYTIKYDSQLSVKRALTYMVKRKLIPVLAVRDFNITPQMVETRFKVNPDNVGYPEIEERIAYSGMKDERDDKTCAVMAIDSMNNYSETLSAGKRVAAASKLNMILGVISAVVGVPLVFYLLYTGAASSVTPFNVLYYLVLWMIPIALASIGVSRR